MIRPGIWRRELTVPLQSIQAELNRLFDEYWRPPGMAPDGPTGPDAGGPGAAATDDAVAWTPAIDLWDAPGELTVVVDLPGVDPATIDLSLAGNLLSIRGDKPGQATKAAGSGPGAARNRVRERATGTFHRQVTLVEEVDFDRVEAQSRDGVLTVRLPKRTASQPRTIPIQATTA